MYRVTLFIPKTFAVSESWESTEDAHFKTVSFTRTFLGAFTALKLKFTERVDEDSTERLTYSSKDRSLVLECDEEERFLEHRDRIIFGLLNF